MFKTAIFKLHNPSVRKRALLQKAFKNYHLLYDKLLQVIHDKLDDFYSAIAYSTKKGEISYSDKKAVQYINSQYKNILNAFILSSGLKESLCKDLAGNLLSYKELLKQRPNTSYPSLQKLKENEKEKTLIKLHDYLALCIDDEEYNYLRDEIARQCKEKKKIKPLTFIRCDASHQNMTFLYKPDKKKYFALLHLLPSSSKKLTFTKDHGLYDVRTGELFVRPKGTSTGLLFPIETGQRVVDRYLNGKGEPKEGKLVYDSESDEYYLHLSFEFKPEKVLTETVMGIGREIEDICAYSILDMTFNVLEGGFCEGKTLIQLIKKEEENIADIQRRGRFYRLSVRRKLADRIIHETTNIIADIALIRKSQVFVKNMKSLTDRSKPRRNSKLNKALNRSQIQKFVTFLDYKLQQRGLPKTKEVNAAYINTACIECGHIDPANKPKHDGNPAENVFRCVICGHEEDARKNISKVIALKGVWQYIKKEDKIKRDIDTFQKFLQSI